MTKDFYSHRDMLASKHRARHLSRFFGLRCAADLLAWRVFPNTKEITETMGAVKAVFDYIPIAREQRATCVVVGDGQRPRTAATFACLTQWECISIDPDMLPIDYTQIHRLTVVAKRIEETPVSSDLPTVIVLVHSHATPLAALKAVTAKERYLVSIPCCVQEGLPHRPYIGYQDEQIWSPKNLVQVWNKPLDTRSEQR